MSGVATAIAGSAIIGAGASIYASGKAADAQKDAAAQAGDLNMMMYYQSREDLLPWLEAGHWALGKPSREGRWKKNKDGPGKKWIEGRDATGLYALLDPDGEKRTNYLRETPGYQFRLGEGQKSVERSAAARGGLLGGATQKALTRYGQDYASNEYNKEFNRLLAMSGSGQSAANVLTSAGAAAGGRGGQNYLYGGDARASGYINNANAVTGNMRGGLQDWMFYKAMK